MKYSMTSRTLCVVFHAIIAAAMGLMGIWFGIFVVPEFLGSNPQQFYGNFGFDRNGAFFLWYELAVVGLSLFVISLLGLIDGIKSILDSRNDEPVVRSFNAFICDGWVAAIFFALQGMLLWDLTANGSNVAFVIVMALLIAIVLLIATNIPMVRLYDQRDQMPLLVDFMGTGALVTGVMGVEALVAMLGASTWANQRGEVTNLLAVIVVASFIAFALLLVAWLLSRNSKKNSKKVANGLTSGAMAVVGVGLAVYGILDIIWQYAPGSGNKTLLPVHLYSKNVGASGNTFDLGFGIMAIVLGALLVVGATVVFMIINREKEETKPVQRDY